MNPQLKMQVAALLNKSNMVLGVADLLEQYAQVVAALSAENSNLERKIEELSRALPVTKVANQSKADQSAEKQTDRSPVTQSH